MRSCLFGCLVVCSVGLAWADDPPKSEEKAAKPLPGQQDLDDPVETLKPVKARSLEEDNRLKAGAWLATGRILETKADNQGALEAYRKAAGLDPQAAEVYRAMVGVGIKLNMLEEVLGWATKVTELDPNEFNLRVQLGNFRMQQRDPAGALKFWEEALRSPRFRKENTNSFVTVNRDIAIIYMALGRKDEAARCFEVVFSALAELGEYALDFETRTQLLGNDPASTFEQLGEVFIDTRRFDLALQALEKAASRKPGGSATLNFNFARAYFETDKLEKSLEELQKYFDAQRQSKGRAPYELLRGILKKLDKEAEFLGRIETIAEKDSRNSDLQFYLAEQYRDAKRLDDAERVYRKTLLFASELQGYQGLASVYRQQGKPADLLEMLGKAYAAQPLPDIDLLKTELKAIAGDEKLLAGFQEAADAARKNSRLDFPSAVVVAYTLSEAGRQQAAEDFFRYALSLRKAKDVYFGLVDVLFDQRKYAEAVTVLEEADRDGGEDRINYLFTLVRAREFAGDTEGAIRDLNTLKRLNPALAENDQIAYQEAWIYYHAHRFDEAIPLFEKLVSKAGQKSIQRQAQFSLSNIYVLKGDYRRGEQILEEVYKESPDDVSVNNDLGYLYADQGKNLDQAEKMVRMALKSDPDNGAYLDSMGWVLFKLGKYEEALPYLEKACQKSTGAGDETLFDHLGDAYDKAGKPAKALEAWKTGLKHAREASRPDKKLVERLEEKIKARESDPGKLKPAQPNSP